MGARNDEPKLVAYCQRFMPVMPYEPELPDGHFGRQVRLRWYALGWTGVARTIAALAGIGRHTLSRIELGYCEPVPETKRRLDKVLTELERRPRGAYPRLKRWLERRRQWQARASRERAALGAEAVYLASTNG